MTKIQHLENSIHPATNVGRVLISMGVQALIQKGSISSEISKGHMWGNFGIRGPYGPYRALAAIPFMGE